MIRYRRFAQIRHCELLLACLLAALMTACGSSSSAGGNSTVVAISVTPGSPSVSVGATQKFTATVTGTTNTAVTWSVQEANGGTIDSAGNYTAPMKAGHFHVVAVSQADSSKSAGAPVAVTAPAPVFAGAAPTDAAEGVTYTYAASATDPVGTAVTLALTAAPSGAAFTGNTVSWTPTWDQSRVNNLFTITASSDAGGTATQSWTIAPSGTVYGHRLIHYWGDGKDTVVPYPDDPLSGGRNPGSIMIWVPQPDGTLAAIPGTKYPDGTFQFSNVPAGPYIFAWLGHAATPVGHLETSSTLYLEGDQNGYPPLDPSQWWPEGMVVNVDGFDPFVFDPNNVIGSDVFDIYDRDGYWDYTAWLPNGGTSFSVRLGWMLQNAPSVTDRFVAVQGKTVPGTDPFQSLVMGPSWIQRFSEISDGTTTTFAGQLVRSTPGQMDLNITFSAWASALNSAGPSAASPYLFDVFEYSTVKEPVSSLSDPLVGGVIPILAVGEIGGTSSIPWPTDGNGNNIWPSDGDYGTLNYNTPFGPEEKTVYVAAAVATVQIPFPGSPVPLPWRVDLSYSTTTPPNGPIVPLMQPPANGKIDGVDLVTGGSIASTTPTLTWDVPAGAPGTTRDSLSYEVFVCEPTFTGGKGGGTAACALSLFVSNVLTNSYTVPAGILQPGHAYIYTITAVSERDRDPINYERYSYPIVTATFASAAISVDGAPPKHAQSTRARHKTDRLCVTEPMHHSAAPGLFDRPHNRLVYNPAPQAAQIHLAP